jgi:hypothetical protein
LFLFQYHRNFKGPLSTTIGGRRVFLRWFWGGHLSQTLGTRFEDCSIYTRVEYTKDWPGGHGFRWECSPTTLVALATSYFSSWNKRQSLVFYPTAETGGLLGDQGSPQSKRHMVVSASTKSKRKWHSWLSPIGHSHYATQYVNIVHLRMIPCHLLLLQQWDIGDQGRGCRPLRNER